MLYLTNTDAYRWQNCKKSPIPKGLEEQIIVARGHHKLQPQGYDDMMNRQLFVPHNQDCILTVGPHISHSENLPGLPFKLCDSSDSVRTWRVTCSEDHVEISQTPIMRGPFTDTPLAVKCRSMAGSFRIAE